MTVMAMNSREDVAEEEIHFDRILNKDQDVTISELRDPGV